jgi:murein DD-endopeptidase MepM/ murein hydrolase activator NlpD
MVCPVRGSTGKQTKSSRRAVRAICASVVVALLVLGALFPYGVAARPIWSRKGVEPYQLPVSRTLLTRKKIMRPHHDHPAWDFNVAVGTRTFSVQAGKVVAVLHWGTCGTGIVIDGFDGFRYTYCHGSRALVGGGNRVHSGDPIMRTGNSGSSGRPHLHLEIETRPRLRLKCPQPLLLSWWRGGQMTPRQAPFKGCTF